MKRETRAKTEISRGADAGAYDAVLADVVGLLDEARRTSARAVNAIMTATYWAIGRRLFEEEQGGRTRAGYGEELVEKLSRDLSARFGRGFGRRNLFQMRAFYLAYAEIVQTASAQLEPSPEGRKVQTASALSRSTVGGPAIRFPLPWSHYVRLLGVVRPEARRFYEAEALRGGWTVRQLTRQIDSQFYERTALSRNKAAMLKKGQVAISIHRVRQPSRSQGQPWERARRVVHRLGVVCSHVWCAWHGVRPPVVTCLTASR
jgi:hypothetical protein